MTRGFFAVGLDNPKTEVNVGGVIRTARAFDAAFVAVSGKRVEVSSGASIKSERHIPVLRTPDVMSVIPFDTIPIAIEFLDDSLTLPSFKHPQRAYYVFGQEDGTLGKRVLDKCKYTVSIPSVYCLNLACAVSVVLYDRVAKRQAQISSHKEGPCLTQSSN